MIQFAYLLYHVAKSVKLNTESKQKENHLFVLSSVSLEFIFVHNAFKGRHKNKF